MQQPFYDATKSYDENYNQGPFGIFAQKNSEPLPKPQSSTFLGFNVDIPFGIPAGPLLNSKFIQGALNWGFSLVTYKTVRGNKYPCHPSPNVIRLKVQGVNIRPGDTVQGDLAISSIDATKDGITNSFGVPSKPPQIWQEDVKNALKNMTQGNLLILSFMGTKKEEMTFDEYVKDFSRTCTLAKETGAPVLEVNLSCPNVGKEGLICNDVETSRAILEALKAVKGNIPLIVKIGYFASEQQQTLEALLEAINENAEGVSAINTIPAKVIDQEGKQILPGSPVRLVSGTCGATIKWAGLELAERIVSLKKQRGWNSMTVVGVGGVTTPHDYHQYINLGVDAVMSATGAMWNPRLALEIRDSLKAKVEK